jgi:hypothetical protein
MLQVYAESWQMQQRDRHCKVKQSVLVMFIKWEI